jgi:hypothetical protein
MVVMQHKVADYGSGNQAREGENVGDGVDVFVGSKLFESTSDRLLWIWRRFTGDLSVFIRSNSRAQWGEEMR